MIEIFSIMHSSHNIAGISIEELNDVFINNNSTSYVITMIGKNKIILKNKEENKFEKLDCICNYFDTNGITDCNDIKEKCTGKCDSCKECFKCALQKLESGDMTLK